MEAAHHAWRPTNPWHQLYSDIAGRAGPPRHGGPILLGKLPLLSGA